MAKKTDDGQYVLETITEEELFIVRVVREAEKFTTYGWDRWGVEWPEHIPTMANAGEWCLDRGLYAELVRQGALEDPAPRPVVNAFTRYFFNGFGFQRYQAIAHYCPVPDIQIMGGVGSGKTTPCSISAIVRCSINPGYRTLWVAPILPQAKLSYEVILQWGASGRWGDVFLQDSRRHPYPLILIKPWDPNDPGGLLECRSLGQDPAELLRGGEYDEGVADEGMRAYSTGWYIALIAGRLRGPRQYMLNAFPELREEYAGRVEEIEWCENPLEREKLQNQLEKWIKVSGIGKQTRLTVIGNPPRGAEWWRRWQYGLENPHIRYSARWTTYGNLYVTKQQIQLQERQYRGREEEMKVELEAARPPAGGDVFPYLDSFFNGELLTHAVEMVAKDVKGWVVHTHEEIGLYHYEKPPEKGATYAFALDPGSGVLPNRNKWVLLGARIDRGPHNGLGPFEIVYIRAGNLPGAHGTPDPWIKAAKDVRQRYPIPEQMFGTESSGVQKNTHWVVWRDDLILTPIFLNNVMMTLIMEAQRTVGADMWMAPDCPMFSDELAEFALKMDKNAPQDFASCFLILNHLVYPLVHMNWELEEDEDEEYWETWEVDERQVRDTTREVRVR